MKIFFSPHENVFFLVNDGRLPLARRFLVFVTYGLTSNLFDRISTMNQRQYLKNGKEEEELNGLTLPRQKWERRSGYQAIRIQQKHILYK